MKPSFEQRLQKARKQVAHLDRCEGHRDRLLSTILCALESGLRRPETNSHFEAYVMLEERAKEEHAMYMLKFLSSN